MQYVFRQSNHKFAGKVIPTVVSINGRLLGMGLVVWIPQKLCLVLQLIGRTLGSNIAIWLPSNNEFFFQFWLPYLWKTGFTVSTLSFIFFIFQIQVKGNSSKILARMSLNSSTNSVILNNLTMGAFYTARVVAFTVIGLGPYSAPINIHMDPNAVNSIAPRYVWKLWTLV